MLRILRLIAGKYRMRMLRVILISVLEAIFGAVPFVILYFLLCDIAGSVLSLHKFGVYVVVVLGSAVFRMLLSYLSITLSRADGTIMMKDLRLRLGEHIRKLPLGFFSCHDTGELSTKILDNVNRTEQIITMLLPGFISTFVLSLLVVAGLFFIDYRMAVATIITMPLALGLLVWAKRIMQKRGKALYESSEDLANGIIEFVNGIKIIKSFNNSAKKLEDLVEKMADFKIKSLRSEGTLSPVMTLSGISIDFGLVMLILMGAFYMIGGSLSGKTFIIFIIISSRFFDNLKSISLDYMKIRYLLIAGQTIEELFAEKPLSGEKYNLPEGCADIVFDHASFGYGSVKVLDDINVSIPGNSMTAIVGPSGSGKSTMANLIARFYDVDEGAVLFGGRNIKKIDPEDFLKRIGMVFQKVILFKDTIFNNIRTGKIDATREEVIEAAKRANCHDFISGMPMGYETMVDENGSNLSGGEQLRISIARVILKDAPVVLLDEATSSLDPENEFFIQEAISNLLKDKTVIVIAHRLKTIKNADKIIVLDNKKICEEGTHDELLARKGLYSEMWRTQQNAVGWKISN
ncbi:MAG: ABC transporter ATP-binding protein/permease [Bacteroidales bacterium]|jgi:ATP-binding cassette subfamily B protein|nr:ABC transporter ATP-binding protein/permease [Bacteroidales bacterium]